MNTTSNHATGAAERTPGDFRPAPPEQVVEFWQKNLPGMIAHCRKITEGGLPEWLDHLQQKPEPPAGETPVAERTRMDS